MGGVAYADVCAAVSEAGGFGTLGMAAEDPDGIREEMRRVRELTEKPFGVDLLAALPDSMLRAIDVIVDEGAKAFIAGLGVPRPVIRTLPRRRPLVMSMCGKVSHAVAAEQAGCDVVVAQGTEAGGHTGPGRRHGADPADRGRRLDPRRRRRQHRGRPRPRRSARLRRAGRLDGHALHRLARGARRARATRSGSRSRATRTRS